MDRWTYEYAFNESIVFEKNVHATNTGPKFLTNDLYFKSGHIPNYNAYMAFFYKLVDHSTECRVSGGSGNCAISGFAIINKLEYYGKSNRYNANNSLTN